MKNLPKTTTEYILWSLVPYTEPNLKLVFSARRFFNDLETISNKKRQTLRNSYYESIHKGLIVLDDQNIPKLTAKGKKVIKRYKPQHLGKHAKLIVMFDIPEGVRYKRTHLRLLLKELSFEQVQKSVWSSPYDHRDYIKSEIKKHYLEDFVQVYEAQRLSIT
jgi:DNA-binding transcriptional regulator PaaX